MKKKSFLNFFVFLIVTQFTIAQTNSSYWEKTATSTRSVNFDRWTEQTDPSKYNVFTLDLNELSSLLNTVSRVNENSVEKPVTISFPNANGILEPYEVFESSVMAEELQNKYPNLRSYVGKNTKRPHEVIYFSFTPMGLKAVILNADEGTQYIDVVSKDKTGYISYFAKDLFIEGNFECYTEDAGIDLSRLDTTQFSRNADDELLREYELALACTEEYALYHTDQAIINGDIPFNATDPEKKGAVLAVMTDIMTRINAVFMNELSIKMNLVANNENIIFLQDSFLDNDDIDELIDNSQTAIDNFLGSTYDMGHMLYTGSGGLAQLRSVCANSGRARAVSGTFTGSPVGLIHENIIRHEMGHQFGARHTYNSDACAGPPTPSSAVEPGGGTTIMSYAGICSSASNIISTNDLYFHQVSLIEIWAFVGNGTGDDCATLTATRNDPPVAIAGGDFSIPLGTPFKLIGDSTDNDGINTHTYCWEQFDLGDPGLPTNTAVTGPIIRSYIPSASNTRYIPKLEDYLNNVNASTQWEKLPVVARNINFKLTVRDNDVVGGQVGVDDALISVVDTAGPFEITSQSDSGSIFGGNSSQTVTWNVANTDTALGVSEVNILLSTDGGLTYDTVLVSNTPNDGSESIVLPNIAAPECRIMVEAIGNIFYNINTESFRIRMTLSTSDSEFSNSISVFPNPNSGEFNINFETTSNENVNIQIYDLQGRSVLKQVYSASGRFNETIFLNNVQSGLYLMEIQNGLRKGLKKIIIE